jgi:hypothetical protein
MAPYSRRMIAHAAYDEAWLQFCKVPNLTPSERHNGAVRLRYYVKTMLDNGEDDPKKIANLALDLALAPEQTARARTRTGAASKISQAA